MNRRYIFLARHGSVDRDPSIPEEQQALSKEGQIKTLETARAFADYLKAPTNGERISIGEVWHAGSTHARQTALLFYYALAQTLPPEQNSVLGEGAWRPQDFLNPVEFWQTRGDLKVQARNARTLLDRVEELNGEAQPNAPNAILVVGHQPQLDWLAGALTQGGWLAGKLRNTPPISRSEVACIAVELDDPWYKRWLKLNRWFKWSLAPTDEKTEAQLLEKIKSKMNVAQLLGGLLLPVLALILPALLQDPANVYFIKSPNEITPIPRPTPSGSEARPLPQFSRPVGVTSLWQYAAEWLCWPLPKTWAMYAAVCLFLISLGLYLATVYAYDRLLMPKRFWGEGTKKAERRWLVERPPSSSTLVLYQNMMRVWSRLFTPATCTVVIGWLCLAAAVFGPVPLYGLLAATALALIFLYVPYRCFRPQLGTED